MMIFDTHAHYDDPAFDVDREDLLASFPEAGIGRVTNICCTLRSLETTRKLTENYSWIYGAAGIHPENAGELTEETFARVKPEIVFHLAAQPIVRESYRDPVGTFGTNVMGTVNVLECVRLTDSVKSFVNVTTDKVYLNREWEYGYRENDRLDGFDPYSNSKSCSELVTASYRRSFFGEGGRQCAISTCRAGNVIGGGDFAKDRIIPDCVRAAAAGKPVAVRNPNSTRPYQHVLEPLFLYLRVAMEQFSDPSLAGSYNVGPDDQDCVTTGELADLFCEAWGGVTWESGNPDGPHEANFLKLDCSHVKKVFGWRPKMHVKEAVQATADWSKAYLQGKNMLDVTDRQIRAWMEKE